jgi:hypothetical protein
MARLDPQQLLELWERGSSRHPIDRSALLYTHARPEVQVDTVADVPLGDVTAGVLRLRAEWFGDVIQAHVDCPDCGVRLQLGVAVSGLLTPVEAPSPEPVQVGGDRYRLPTLRDLAAVAREHDITRARLLLLSRCRLDAINDNSSALSDTAIADVENALEAADPNADLALAVHCAACGRTGVAQLDAAALLWEEIDVYARQLLNVVDRLARAYGWNERDVLSLSDSRRAAYLSMVGS